MNISIEVKNNGDIRIDSWLVKNLETSYTRSYVQKLISGDYVKVNGKVIKSNYKIKIDDCIELNIPAPEKTDIQPEMIPIEIIYEDSDLIVVNKPKGMVVHPGAGNYSGTLVNALLACCEGRLSDINGTIRPGIVHRLDKDTSGLLLVAKNNVSHENLSSALKNHDIKRVYSTIVKGIVPVDKGRIDAPLGRHHTDRKKISVNVSNGKRAITHFIVNERFKDASYLDVELETGRTHQIRVHLSYIGHPVLGDKVYGTDYAGFQTNGQVLHARKITFKHPTTKELMSFETVLPEYFTRLLQLLRCN